MKKIISFLTALLLSVTAVSVCMAENTEALDASLLTVYATYKDEKVDVTRQVMEIDGSLAAPDTNTASSSMTAMQGRL